MAAAQLSKEQMVVRFDSDTLTNHKTKEDHNVDNYRQNFKHKTDQLDLAEKLGNVTDPPFRTVCVMLTLAKLAQLMRRWPH